jgi:hypothetical protein
MKQIFSALAVIIMITSSKNSGAQNTNEVAFNNSTSTVNLPANFPDKKTSETKVTYLKVTQVNISAVRNFIRYHKNVSDERWFKTKDGYIANFLSKGIDTRIVYDDKGRWLYNIFVYSEDKMPFNIRHSVKSQYYDDDITEIRQYETRDKTVYIVFMKDQQSNTEILKVSDSEMEDITPHGKKN